MSFRSVLKKITPLRAVVLFCKKIKEDCKRIFFYPKCVFGPGLSQDHNSYWKKRRQGDKAILSDWQRQRADIVLDFIKPNSAVLDVGCGDGAVLGYLHDKAGIKGIGLDINEEILQKAESLGLKTICLDLTRLEQLEQLPEVDYVTGFEIIEHMPNPEEFIYRISKKARKGLLFSVPNTGYYAHRLRLLFGRFPLQWIIYPGEHLRFWTVRDMKHWVKAIGFKLKKFVKYEGLPGLNKIWPSMFAQGMIIYIKKNKD